MTSSTFLSNEDSEPQSKLLLHENSSEPLCSQDYFCTPDFLTPVDDQFSLGLEGSKDVEEKRFSSIRLSPEKKKRPPERQNLFQESEDDEGIGLLELMNDSSHTVLPSPSPPSPLPFSSFENVKQESLEKDEQMSQNENQSQSQFEPFNECNFLNRHEKEVRSKPISSPLPLLNEPEKQISSDEILHVSKNCTPKPVVCYKRKRKTNQNLPNKRQQNLFEFEFKFKNQLQKQEDKISAIDFKHPPNHDSSNLEKTETDQIVETSTNLPDPIVMNFREVKDSAEKAPMDETNKTKDADLSDLAGEFNARIRMLEKTEANKISETSRKLHDSISLRFQPARDSAERDRAEETNTIKDADVAGESASQFKTRIRMLRKSIRSNFCMINPFLKEDEERYGVGCSMSEEGQRKALNNLFSVRSSDASCPYPSRYRNDFHEIKVIGCGSFSLVSMVRSKTDGCLYAIKRSNSKLVNSVCRKNALLEVQAMASLEFHPCIIRYYTSWVENDYIYIQLELCESNLSSLLEKGITFNENELINILKQIGQALHFLHANDTCHLDIKPDNIFTINGGKSFKLGDFGRVRKMDGSMDVEEGDARYMPPDLLRSMSTTQARCQLAKADVYSLGVSVYELAMGKKLPSSETFFSDLRKGRFRVLSFSVPFQNLLKALMNPEPELRPSAEDLLNHPLLK